MKDAPVVGRLAQSHNTGILSYAGLFGYGDVNSIPDDRALVNHQYDIYQSRGKFQEFVTYNSTIGFQGILIGFFDHFSIFSASTNWKIYQLGTAFLSGIALSLIVMWIYVEFGLIAALSSIGFMLLSEWLTLFGGSIYWSLWAIYLPLIVAGYSTKNIHIDYKSWKKLFFIVYASILIKCLFNGFEYITVALIMGIIPLVYYWMTNHWEKKTVFKTAVTLITAQGLAVFTALIILLYQNAIVLKGINNAINHIVYVLEKRSIGNPLEFTGPLSERIQANLSTVIKSYLTGRSINIELNELSLPLINWQLELDFDVRYTQIFGLFLLFTILFVVFQRFTTNTIKKYKLKSFILVTWISIIAPLSWFVLFKAHSYKHVHMNFIIWQMPFTILGFGMCGAIVQYFIEARK